MTPTLDDRPCIAIERSFADSKLFTVAEYDDGLDRSRSIGTVRGLVFHRLIWTRGAPPVERLTPEGVQADEGLIRICDREAYDLQMRQLLGLV